ncbi:hypothetical protein JZ751_024137 [Albula glossodonta]|uniref:Adiponectin receptor 2 n=1 Tax=Albula glossodonta TaxID=121402 RepID=A0A8T2NHB6_9TELE|nr:hypothetical protein JZ751_024137 [Albula glossodonta]
MSILGKRSSTNRSASHKAGALMKWSKGTAGYRGNPRRSCTRFPQTPGPAAQPATFSLTTDQSKVRASPVRQSSFSQGYLARLAREIPDHRRCENEEERQQQQEAEEEEEKSSDEGFMGMTPLLQAHHAMERMEEFVHKMWEGRWRVIPHDVLPDWLKDNDYLLHGHRPPMPSFRACFKSIFRIHTETGNIWTHLLGCLFFLCLGIVYMFRPNMSFVAPFQEKIVIGMFFLGAILCLSFSWLFHTVYCHSEGVSRVFSKCVRGARSERGGPHAALCDLRGLFHILVVAGAFVHFHGVSNLQEFRYTAGAGCAEEGAL